MSAAKAAKTFSLQTIRVFEDASASIPLRPLDRAFESANVRLGIDPGGTDGARRVQFRRYVASIDQRKPKDLEQLGRALGALIDEVAESKQAFLIAAAGRDGFAFAGGVFRPAPAMRTAAADDPGELAESICRTVLRLCDAPPPKKKTSLAALAASVLAALEQQPASADDAALRRYLQSLCHDAGISEAHT